MCSESLMSEPCACTKCDAHLVSDYFGQAAGFIWGPVVVGNYKNATDATIRSRMTSLYIQHAVISCIIAIAICVYFPSHPPTPPTNSAAQKREKLGLRELWNGLCSLVRIPAYWVLVFTFGLPLGTYSGFAGCMGIFMTANGVSLDAASIIGAVSVIVGCICGVGCGFLADSCVSMYKTLIVCLYTFASAFLIALALMVCGVIPASPVGIGLLVILCGGALNASVPIFYEAAVEATYPVPEGAVAGSLVIVQNALQSVFLAVPVSQLGTSWMAVSIAGIVIAADALLVFGWKETNARRAVDAHSTVIADIPGVVS